MELLVEWTRTLHELGQVFPVHELVASVRVIPDRLGVILIYLFAFVWLCYRRRNRYRPKRQAQLARALAGTDRILRLLGAAGLLALGVLIALARAAGRPHSRW